MGLDFAVTVVDTLKRDLGWELADPPDWLRRKVHDGQLGRKTGQEFYIWTDGKAVKAKDVDAPDPGVASPPYPSHAQHFRDPSPRRRGDR
ncbi:3-hydroxyacyl-CoA dehydrogenase family protein [Caulobacter sp. S45]|uniref:3-hydroxyacyl-CoA dehydrogenase family protein n=1 Tax=Caulobacter sp. S45 TaxID=1641861 RepID=UPI0021110AF3|nr:3-hydroxyacyl-CoA dehydrogenase family protein [Caulobacter sp. S45]